MSTLNKPISSRCSIALTSPARSHFQCTLNRERVRMNVATHQEKEKNEKTGKRNATNFKKAACCPFAVVQGAARRKIGLCEGSARGIWNHRESQQSFLPNPNGIGDRTTTLRRLLIGAVQFCLLNILYIGYERNIALHYPERLESIRVLGTDRRSVLIIRVKVTQSQN